MRKLTITISIFLLLGCTKGVWVTKTTYRPKHPKFSILKDPFKGNELIDNKVIYVSTKRFFNYDGKVIIGYMGFLADGRMIIGSTNENEMDQTLNEKNSFTTASAVGYYNTTGNTIKMEYFLAGEGGYYETREGMVRKDTIIIVDKFPMLFKKDIRYDTLVRSRFHLSGQ